MALDRLDDDDRIVNHQADGEHEAEHRKRIDGEAEQRKKCEGADERNRNGEQRNQRGAPALEENVDHDNHQQERDHQRDQDFAHAFR